jgi:alpha-N-arabinofuranosidase
MHKFTPDYYQSFGLGFFEYFQLSEDLGAEPLPILSCGIACQFNTGELVPLEDLDPYVKDALDLIEFANGDTSTYWGKLRADMGHPEPFDMKYIGIGNEQWGPAYIERYKIFHEAIKTTYPDMIIVSGSGPFPDGDYFEYGWEQLKQMDAEIVDEHYYRPPAWFLENADRYDEYDRSGPKVFAGEYAGHPRDFEDGPKENNWLAALAEAAFMTGLERNADIVTLTSYAPLMAHADAWQWAPDLIWFNNLESYGTANYMVQKLFSTNPGTDVVSITENKKALVGQNSVYASAVKDVERGEIIIKIVNVKEETQKISIDAEGLNDIKSGSISTMSSYDLSAINSFDNPENISLVIKDLELKSSTVEITLEVNSVNMIKLKL